MINQEIERKIKRGEAYLIQKREGSQEKEAGKADQGIDIRGEKEMIRIRKEGENHHQVHQVAAVVVAQAVV